MVFLAGLLLAAAASALTAYGNYRHETTPDFIDDAHQHPYASRLFIGYPTYPIYPIPFAVNAIAYLLMCSVTHTWVALLLSYGTLLAVMLVSGLIVIRRRRA